MMSSLKFLRKENGSQNIAKENVATESMACSKRIKCTSTSYVLERSALLARKKRKE